MNQHQRISDFYVLVRRHQSDVVSAADDAWAKVTSRGEVPRIREFLSGADKGAHLLNQKLPTLFLPSGYEMKFAAIMVHQRPTVVPLEEYKSQRVRPGLPHNPELGDLHLVFLYLDREKNVRVARSVLYQAKIERASATNALAPKDSHQIYLYDKAVGFYYKNGVLSGQKRRLPIAAGRRRGLHYLFVSETPVACSPSPSDSPAYRPWSESLFRLLIDSEGMAIGAGPAKGDGWSRINEDLVQMFCADDKLRTMNLGELASWFNDFKNPDHWWAWAGDNLVGIDTLLVIVKDQELPPLQEVGAEISSPRPPDIPSETLVRHQAQTQLHKALHQAVKAPPLAKEKAKNYRQPVKEQAKLYLYQR